MLMMILLYIYIITNIIKHILYNCYNFLKNVINNNFNKKDKIFLLNTICITSYPYYVHDEQQYHYLYWFSKNIHNTDYIYKYIFKNVIYIYIDDFRYNDFSTKDNHTNTINHNKSISKKSSCLKNETVYYEDKSFGEYNILECNIDKSELDKYLQNKKSINTTYNKIDKLYYNNIINFDKSTKIHYDKFVNLFNDYDNHFIKIGVYGNSNSGKTFFLKNIIKILKKYNKCYVTNFNKQLIKYENFYERIDYYNYIESSLFHISYKQNDSNMINILFLTTDNFDYKLLKYFNDNKFIGETIKTILMIETIEYNNYFDNFDIKFESKFINNY